MIARNFLTHAFVFCLLFRSGKIWCKIYAPHVQQIFFWKNFKCNNYFPGKISVNLILSSRFTSIQLYNNSFVLVFILCLWITFSLTALFEIFQMSWTIIAFTSISILLKIDKITANGSHIYHQVACPKVLLCCLITCYLLRFTCKLKSNSKKKWIEHFR